MEHREITDASVWRRADFPDPDRFTRRLTPAMVAEVEAAVEGLRATGRAPESLTRADVPLPVTAPLLETVYRQIEDGVGFAVLSGWPVAAHDEASNLTAYCALLAHFGRIVVQNYEGQRIVDVRDEGVPYNHEHRGYRSNKLLPFHTDGSDLAALLCLGTAAEGGRSRLVSATAVYNTILAERPTDLEILARGFYHHRRRQHAEGEPPLSPARIPVFAFNGGHLHCCYNRNPIDWVEKEGLRLDAREVAVLDNFDAIVARPEMQVEIDLAPGDIQILNNFTALHSRTAYRDDEADRRHLVRVWLEDPASKRIGESLLDLCVPGKSRFHASG